MVNILLDGGGTDVLMEAGRRHLMHNDVFDGGETAVITNFLAGAMLSVLMWWLEEDQPYTPEEINIMFQQLATSGVGKLLDFFG